MTSDGKSLSHTHTHAHARTYTRMLGQNLQNSRTAMFTDNETLTYIHVHKYARAYTRKCTYTRKRAAKINEKAAPRC